MWMYLAALGRQAWHVSTYFTGALGVVGGGGPPQNETLFRFHTFGQKMTGQKIVNYKVRSENVRTIIVQNIQPTPPPSQ